MMTIQEKVYQPKDFPMIATKNMADMANAALNSGQCNGVKYNNCRNVVASYTNGTPSIDYLSYNDMIYCFDTFFGNTPLYNL